MRKLDKNRIDRAALAEILDALTDTSLDEMSQLREVKNIMTNWAIYTKEWAKQK